jgi:hypothetical protein
LIRHHAQVAARRLNRNEVERNEVRAGIYEHFRSVCVVLGLLRIAAAQATRRD